MTETPTPLRLWIDALRSKKYKQGLFRMRNSDRFSVEGVACDVYATHHPDCSWDNGVFITPDGRHHIIMPPAVWKWLGLNSSDPMLNVKIRYKDLRPEVDGQIRAALAEAEKQDEKIRDKVVRKYTAWKDYWADVKEAQFEGQETLASLNDELQMTFLQISNVLVQLEAL